MRAVKKLGDDQRDCVVLRFMQGLSVSETAEIMGKNDGAIRRCSTGPSASSPSLSEGELR